MNWNSLPSWLQHSPHQLPVSIIVLQDLKPNVNRWTWLVFMWTGCAGGLTTGSCCRHPERCQQQKRVHRPRVNDCFNAYRAFLKQAHSSSVTHWWIELGSWKTDVSPKWKLSAVTTAAFLGIEAARRMKWLHRELVRRGVWTDCLWPPPRLRQEVTSEHRGRWCSCSNATGFSHIRTECLEF